jgi:hypothetical protein
MRKKKKKEKTGVSKVLMSRNFELIVINYCLLKGTAPYIIYIYKVILLIVSTLYLLFIKFTLLSLVTGNGLYRPEVSI